MSDTTVMVVTAAVQAALIVIVAALFIWCALNARRMFGRRP